MPPSPNLFDTARPYVDSLNRLFNTTISSSRLDVLAFGRNAPFYEVARRVHGTVQHLELSRGSLDFSQIITEVDGRVHVVKAEYIYWIGEQWIFRYEYDTTSAPTKPHSHLHVNGRIDLIPDLHNVHFPAGRLSVEHLIFHLVTEHGISSSLPLDEMVQMLGDSYRAWRRTDLRLFP